MNRQLLSRLDGERRAHLTLIRLLCAASVWRVAMTRVLPLAGSAAWWTALACLLPGFAVAALFRGLMAMMGTATLTEAVRACLGRVGALLISLTLGALLLTEGISAITALITLFTQGVGTRGTQLTLAILTGVALLFCLHREGLPRAAHLLRWGMIVSALLIAVFLLTEIQPDHLFPLCGEGYASILSAGISGLSLGWPAVLLLTEEPPSGMGRLRSGIIPAFAAVAAVLLVTLLIPHELLMRQHGLAALLLLPTRFAPNGLQVVALCLLMLTFFLSIGASAQLATAHLCMPMKSAPAWLPYVLLAAMFLTQAADPAALWDVLAWIEPWLLLPLIVLVIVCLPIAFIRRKKP